MKNITTIEKISFGLFPMDFKTRRISKHTSYKTPRKKMDPKFKMQLLTLIGGTAFVIFLLFSIVQIIKSLDFSNIIFSFGKRMITDQNGRTNILLLGVGGGEHDGANLTDTVMLANIDYEDKLVPMLSIPRDLYVETKQTGRSRINEIYYLAKTKYGDKQGLETIKDTVGKITNQEIQYYIKVDFSGFVKIVDALGGVDINVENDIYDPFYPHGETIQYETFSIKAGPNHMDGETALKYARSRKTTSDFDRAKRQQQLLFAIKEKALSLNILTNPEKIQQLYNSVADSVDTNLSLAEILELAKLSRDMGKESVIPMVINDDPTSCGGFIYTPDREYFGGASVLLPAGGNYDPIHRFVGLIFGNIKTIQQANQNEIQVLNGTKVPGLAQEVMDHLSRHCLNVVYYGNASDRDMAESTIYYKLIPGQKTTDPPTIPPILPLIQTLIPNVKIQEGIPETYLSTEKRVNTTIVVELGKDYLTKRLENPFDKLKYLSAPTPKTTQQSSQTTAKVSTQQ